MKVVNERHFDDFSLYFLATNPPSSNTDDAGKYTMSLFNPILELTHNHGTEKDESFQHYNGNEAGRQGVSSFFKFTDFQPHPLLLVRTCRFSSG